MDRVLADVRVSKLLSLVLRHRPGVIGIELDGAGWVDIDSLLVALQRYGRPITRADLDLIIGGANKRRFAVHDGRIRAAQGHSVSVDLRLDPARPGGT